MPPVRQVAVEDVALGVKESLLVGADAYQVPPQEGDEVFHRPEGRVVKGSGVQFLGQTRGGTRPQPHRLTVPWLVPQEQAKTSKPLQALLEQCKATDVEVGCGDVQRLAAVSRQNPAEHVGQAVLLIVYDVGYSHVLKSYSRMVDLESIDRQIWSHMVWKDNASPFSNVLTSGILRFGENKFARRTSSIDGVAVPASTGIFILSKWNIVSKRGFDGFSALKYILMT